jgi:3-mercaptopyruvate sulfurtransferase SseA
MRLIVAAVAAAAVLVTGIAGAQYKTPQAPPKQPGGVQMAPNNAVQINPATVDEELSKARRITRDEAMRLVKENKAVYVDIRSKETYDEGHLPGAISIPLSQLPNRMRDLPVKKFLITYCA